eukprot:TRINITY_DN8219_c0_g1_i3.p1 TRINITY_DN8219_c0_g1~~TRINITY_DN8219_c0_g1_i3.p1  ORF type:complete len:691 (-),score=98.04 TRINITY_DN8219_c0_g1_i3:69-2141(-)
MTERLGLTEDYSETSLQGDIEKLKERDEYPEITVKGVILTLILSLVLSSANTYLGLFAGLTISVSIPAAIISMAIFSAFKTNILEINAVQTGASTGSSMAAGIIFTLPALIIMHEQDQKGGWTSIKYLQTTVIAALGGLIGVSFSIPLRRALVVEEPTLKFPEGVATAEILEVYQTSSGSNKKVQLVIIVIGIIVGALMKLLQSGLFLWSDVFDISGFIGGYLFFFGLNLSPALLSVGYIVGPRIGAIMLAGAIMNWWIAIPSYLYNNNYECVTQGINQTILNSTQPALLAGCVWSSKTRFLGVGAMLIGGVGTVFSIAPSLVKGIRSAINAFRVILKKSWSSIDRRERDIPLPAVIGVLIVCVIPLCAIFWTFTDKGGVSIFMAFFMLLAGFLFSSVGAYMAGLVGSSNNPISGVTLATVITAAAILLLFLGSKSEIGPSAAILIGSVVCTAAGVAGDTMQDLKTGYLVGSTPLKQQFMQVIGAVAPSFVIAPVISLLISAYGIGEKIPGQRDNPLPAPQANLMAVVSKSIFFGGLPYTLVAIGGCLAALVMITDFIIRLCRKDFRIPVLAVALGLYLPFELETSIFVGGIIALLSEYCLKDYTQSPEEDARRGLLFAAGLITGEALCGILVAIPIVITSNTRVWALVKNPTGVIGLFPFFLSGIMLFYIHIKLRISFYRARRRTRRFE